MAGKQPPYSLTDFAAFGRRLKLNTGGVLKLEPFQRTLLADYFAGTIESVIIVPKKNGKTTLLAALALYHLWRVPEADCVIGAASREQARILFEQAAGLVKRSGLDEIFDVKSGYGVVRLKGNKGRIGIRVLAADAHTADGVIPTLALVDELHRHPNADLYGVFRDGLGPRDGQMLTISTAGATTDSPLGKIREAAHLLPNFRRVGTYNYARSENGAFVFHEWCLDAGDDVQDMVKVKAANPASWNTPAKLKGRHDSPTMTPWQWLRFGCGIWTSVEEPWIEPQAWDCLAEARMVIPDGSEAYIGVDIGVAHDSTGIVVVSPRGRNLLVVAQIMSPPQGASVSLESVEDELRRLAKRYRVRLMAYDPWSFRRSAEILADEGIPMFEFPQSPERMSQASANLYRLIESGELVHDGNAGLRAHVLAGVTKQTERGWRLVKDPRHRRSIDALIALAMAAQVATEAAPEREPLVAWV